MNEMAQIFRNARLYTACGWTQDEFARDENGQPVSPFDSNASCYCMNGALQVVCGENPEPRYILAEIIRKNYRRKMKQEIPMPWISDSMVIAVWNDDPMRTQADVIQLFNAAITESYLTYGEN